MKFDVDDPSKFGYLGVNDGENVTSPFTSLANPARLGQTLANPARLGQTLADPARLGQTLNSGTFLDEFSCSLYGRSFLAGDLDLWHRRMRHVSKQQLKKINALGLVDGFNMTGNANAHCGCDTCAQAKIKRARNERQRHYSAQCKFIGHHVSSDVKSLPYESFEGYKYAILALGLLSKEEIVKASDVHHPMLSTVTLPKLTSREVSVGEFDYLSVVGSLMHLANCVRCDIAYAVGCLARHALNPGRAHVKACKRVVMYLYNTRTLGITYRRPSVESEKNVPTIHEAAKHPLDDGSNLLKTFADSDYAADETRRSTYGNVTMLNGGPIAWTSTLGKTVATSTCEAEVNAAVAAVKDAVHLKRLLVDLKLTEDFPLTILEDNSACIAQANAGLRHVRNAKHYEVKLRFLQQRVVDNDVKFEYCPTDRQLADFFKKPLDHVKLIGFRDSLMS